MGDRRRAQARARRESVRISQHDSHVVKRAASRAPRGPTCIELLVTHYCCARDTLRVSVPAVVRAACTPISVSDVQYAVLVVKSMHIPVMSRAHSARRGYPYCQEL